MSKQKHPERIELEHLQKQAQDEAAARAIEEQYRLHKESDPPNFREKTSQPKGDEREHLERLRAELNQGDT